MRKFVLLSIAAAAVAGAGIAQAATSTTKREATASISPTHNVGKTVGADLRLLTFDNAVAKRPTCRKAVFGGLQPPDLVGNVNYPASAGACVVPDGGKHDDITLSSGMALNNAVFAPGKQIGSGSAVALGYLCGQNNTTSMSTPPAGSGLVPPAANSAEKLTIKIFTTKTSKGRTDSKTLTATLVGTKPLQINSKIIIRITRPRNGRVKLSFDLPHELIMPVDFLAAQPQGPGNTGICSTLVDAKIHLDRTTAKVKIRGKTVHIGLLRTSSGSCPTRGANKGKFSFSNKVSFTDGTVKSATDPGSGFKETRNQTATTTARCKV